jgi:type VI secretion system ImpH/TssG family protein
MAGTDRAQAHDLIDWTVLAQNLRRSGLFAIVRQAEAKARNLPRLGRAKRPAQSIVDLAQQPGLGFADSTMETLEFRHGRPQLRGYWLGLTGPMGALPTHLSEFAYYERIYAEKRPFGDWLDLISGRMLQLFYRAWAESQPVAHADRPDDDRFASWLGALSGGMEGAGNDNAFFGRARVHYAALFAGSRSAIALQDGLGHLLTQPVRVLEYVPKWREFEPEDRSRLGRSYATLGSDAVLGGRVYSAADAFRVVVRAQNLDDYRSLMPGGARFAVAAEAIEAFKPSHLEWDLCVEIDDAEALPLRLDGFARLGWSSWVKRKSALRGPRKRGTARPETSNQIRADAHLRKSSMKKRKPAS